MVIDLTFFLNKHVGYQKKNKPQIQHLHISQKLLCRFCNELHVLLMMKFCPPNSKVKRFCCLLYLSPAPQVRLDEANLLTSQSASLHCSTPGKLSRPHITDPANPNTERHTPSTLYLYYKEVKGEVHLISRLNSSKYLFGEFLSPQTVLGQLLQ